MSDFKLQIVHKDTGKVAGWWNPREAAEADIVEALCDALEKRGGVGFFSSKKAVLLAVREEFPKIIMGLKLKVRPSARP